MKNNTKYLEIFRFENLTATRRELAIVRCLGDALATSNKPRPKAEADCRLIVFIQNKKEEALEEASIVHLIKFVSRFYKSATRGRPYGVSLICKNSDNF